MGPVTATPDSVPDVYDALVYGDRRSREREAAHRRGRLLAPGSGLGCPCVIRDVSDGGAKVEFGPGWRPHDHLVLVDLILGRGYEGQVMWRRNREVGLKLQVGCDLRGLTPRSLQWAKAAFLAAAPVSGKPSFGGSRSLAA